MGRDVPGVRSNGPRVAPSDPTARRNGCPERPPHSSKPIEGDRALGIRRDRAVQRAFQRGFWLTTGSLPQIAFFSDFLLSSRSLSKASLFEGSTRTINRALQDSRQRPVRARTDLREGMAGYSIPMPCR